MAWFTKTLVRLEHRYTTQTALEQEKSILKIECLGRNTLSPLLSLEAAQKKLASLKLTQGQRKAVELMTTTKNRVVGIQGFAGTNKARREMNQMVRKDSGISGRDIEFDTLIRSCLH